MDKIAKFKILEIKGITDDNFGKCILVEANPLEQIGEFTMFTPYVNDKTYRFIYPETQSNISFLTRIADTSLLEIDFDDFQEKRIMWKSEPTTMYRHNSCYKYKN